MARTLEEPLTENELDHLRNEFWTKLSTYKEEQREEAGFSRQLSYEEVKEIMEKIIIAIHYVKLDFKLNPESYGDVLGAEGDFFREILDEADLIDEND